MEEIKKEDLERALVSLELGGGLEISGNPRRAAEFLDAVHVGTEAIRELLRYRKIGSVEAILQAVNVLSLDNEKITAMFDELFAYRKIGTVQECQDAASKQTPVEVTDVHCDEYFCPACGSENLADQGVVEDRHCPACGQAIYQEKEV